jgi:VWFA-related protein
MQAAGVTALVLLAAAPRVDTRAAVPTARTIYLSVVDNKGVPVAGVTAADVTVKENNKEYPVEKFELATGPLQLGLIIDDNGTGAFRGVTAQFIQNLLGKAEFEVVTVMQQVRKLTEFTTDVNALKGAIDALVQRPGASDGTYLTDGILEVGKDLESRKATRPAIVVITAAGPDRSNAQSGDVLRQLKTTMASFNVVSLSNAMVTNEGGGNNLGGLMNQAEGNRALDEGPKQAGGKRYSVQKLADVAAALKIVSDQLASQYVLTYTLPDGVKPHERLQIQVKKGGTTVLAPTKINDK